jgi:2-oxoglutarate decarboxylase
MAKIPAKILHMYVPGATLADALPHLRETYCGTIAYEIEHIASHRQRVWLRERSSPGAFRQPLTATSSKALLRRLVEVDALERFMHKAYLGQHQFSIEGLDMTVPMLDELIQLSAAHGGAGGRDRHGPPRPAERARAQPRPRPTTRSSPSSRAPRRSRR